MYFHVRKLISPRSVIAVKDIKFPIKLLQREKELTPSRRV